MAKRTRIFLVAAGGVLVAGVATALVAWAMDAPLQTALDSTAHSDLVYVPGTARVVGYADVRTFMASELHDKFRQFQRSNPSGTDTLEAQTGINLEKDVDRVLVASDPSGDGPLNAGRSLLVARGRFEPATIEAFVRGRGAQATEYRGKKLMALVGGSTETALAFAEPGLVLFGGRDLVTRSLDAKAGAAPGVSANQEFMRLLGTVDSGTAWMVAQFDSLTNSAAIPGDFAERLPPINWLAASARVDNGLHGLIRAETPDAPSAQNLRDVVQGFMMLAKLQVSRHPEFKGVLDALALSAEGMSVTLSFDFSPTVLDLLPSGNPLRAPVVPQQRANPERSQPVR